MEWVYEKENQIGLTVRFKLRIERFELVDLVFSDEENTLLKKLSDPKKLSSILLTLAYIAYKIEKKKPTPFEQHYLDKEEIEF